MVKYIVSVPITKAVGIREYCVEAASAEEAMRRYQDGIVVSESMEATELDSARAEIVDESPSLLTCRDRAE